ncbi:hypothetical protein [Microbacterium sp. zg-YB36]|uniref:hypothetical protein n=1 Tax=Microbacterium sp. zg-YB36 TaxID=2969407 RepID=UPI00214C2810|nr:hypothetical protein [Microbacterium sp. zg-YB36]MDL5351148.1 hypothetical protein [Microbacterium sp. zg-YB36]
MPPITLSREAVMLALFMEALARHPLTPFERMCLFNTSQAAGSGASFHWAAVRQSTNTATGRTLWHAALIHNHDLTTDQAPNASQIIRMLENEGVTA